MPGSGELAILPLDFIETVPTVRQMSMLRFELRRNDRPRPYRMPSDRPKTFVYDLNGRTHCAEETGRRIDLFV